LNKESKNRFSQYRVTISSILIILTILAAGSLPANAYTIGDYWFCKDVDDSIIPYEPIDPTNIFYDTDERVCFLFILENVITSHGLMVKYYHEEELFNTTYHEIPHPRTEGYDYWSTFSFNHYLLVKGDDAADLPGQWRIEVYIDGKKEFMENFEIRSTTTATTAPTTTTSSSTHSPTPTPILPQQEMTITTISTSTPNQEEEKQVEQSSFLSNPMYMMLIVFSVIVIIILIVLAKRRKPITSKTQQIPNRYCINCGALAQPGEIFCGSCGKRVE